MASFKFSCPHCGKHVEAEEEWGGHGSRMSSLPKYNSHSAKVFY